MRHREFTRKNLLCMLLCSFALIMADDKLDNVVCRDYQGF